MLATAPCTSGEITLPETDGQSGGEATYADRLDTLEGKRLAYVDWGKANGDRLYEEFERILTEGFGVEALDYYLKPTPSSPIPRETLEEIYESDAEGVVLAIADCGSCNSSIAVDAVTLEEQNIPTVRIITDKFLGLNTKISGSHGYDKLPLITLDHPTRYLGEDDVHDIAERITWTVHEILTCEECLLGPETGETAAEGT